jgi:Na+-translocating ferredoxin:NAD+ oxidoreductase RnfC subunit
MKRLDLLQYESKTPFTKDEITTKTVKIYLKQHVGAAAESIVNIGDIVKEGDLIAEVKDGKMGANIHASISGKVSHVSEDFIRISN